MAEVDEDEIERSRMTLGEHLNELRARLFRAAIVAAVFFTVAYSYRDDVKHFAHEPQRTAFRDLREDVLKPRLVERVERGQLLAEEVFAGGVFEVGEDGEVVGELRREFDYLGGFQSIVTGGTFFYSLKLCFYLSLVLAAPYILWEIWGFIAAGLYKHERRAVYKLLPPAIVLFYAGLYFGYELMVPAAIYFTQMDGLGIDPIYREISIDDYWAFLRGLCLAVGVVFQIPVIQVVLSKAGIVAPRTYARFRGHTAIALLVFAAIITPPDVVTQVLLAGPAIVLWEIGYWIARFSVDEEQFRDLTDDGEEPVKA